MHELRLSTIFVNNIVLHRNTSQSIVWINKITKTFEICIFIYCSWLVPE